MQHDPVGHYRAGEHLQDPVCQRDLYGEDVAVGAVGTTAEVSGSKTCSRKDPEIGTALADYLRAEGIDVRTGTTVDRVDRPGCYRVQVSRNGQTEALEAEQLLVATGRRARTAGFGLDTLGVSLGKKGEIVVDDHLETSVPGVTFTDPAVASVGLTEAEARARGIEPLVSRLPMEHVARALAARDTRGFVKLVADPATLKILGAQILASEAGEMITEPVLAIRFGLTIEDITSTFHPYLTLSEGIKLAAQTFDKDVGRLSCCAA